MRGQKPEAPAGWRREIVYRRNSELPGRILDPQNDAEMIEAIHQHLDALGYGERGQSVLERIQAVTRQLADAQFQRLRAIRLPD